MSTSPLGNYLVSLTKAERALQAAQTLPEIKQMIDPAGAVKEYAKAASLGESAPISTEKIRRQAQRKAGGLLNQLEKGKAGRPKKYFAACEQFLSLSRDFGRSGDRQKQGRALAAGGRDPGREVLRVHPNQRRRRARN